MKTLLFQPVNLTDVWQPNPRWKGPGSPDASGQAQSVAQTDWYQFCQALGYRDFFCVENQTLNRANWWMNAQGSPSTSIQAPPVPYAAAFKDVQASLPPDLSAVQACAKLAVNPARFVAKNPDEPRLPICFDIEDDGTGLWQSTLYAGMYTTPAQRQKAAQLMLGAIRAVKQVDQQIPVWWYGAPYCVDGAIRSDADYQAWRDTLVSQAQVAVELDAACYSLYAWDDVIADPSLNFSMADRIKGTYAQFFAGQLSRRVILISPLLYPNLNGSMAALAGQVMPFEDWKRLVDYLLGEDQPWAIGLWPSGLVDPVEKHIKYLADMAA